MQKVRSFLIGLIVGTASLAPAVLANVLANDVTAASGGVALLISSLAVLFLLKRK